MRYSYLLSDESVRLSEEITKTGRMLTMLAFCNLLRWQVGECIWQDGDLK